MSRDASADLMSAHFVTLMDTLRRRLLRVASWVEDMIDEACDAALCADESLADRVIRRDREIDMEEVAIESEVIRLIALFQPMGSDLRHLCTILKINNDLERAADCAVNVAERARHLHPDAAAVRELRSMVPLVRQSLHTAFEAYAAQDEKIASRVLAQDEAVDAVYGEMIRSLSNREIDSKLELSEILDLLSIAKNLERIADHATNIAEDVIYLATGHIVRHQYGQDPSEP